MHTIFAKAVAFKEAMSEGFQALQRHTVDNARALAAALIAAWSAPGVGRHRESSHARGPAAAQSDRQGGCQPPRGSRHRREQEHRPVRPQAAGRVQRHSPGHAGAVDARHGQAARWSRSPSGSTTCCVTRTISEDAPRSPSRSAASVRGFQRRRSAAVARSVAPASGRCGSSANSHRPEAGATSEQAGRAVDRCVRRYRLILRITLE